MAVQMPNFSIPIMPENSVTKINSGTKIIMTYMCNMYVHTFAAYDLTQQIIIKEIHVKMKILQDIISAVTVIGLRNGSRSEQTQVQRAPFEFIGTISQNLFGLANTMDINI